LFAIGFDAARRPIAIFLSRDRGDDAERLSRAVDTAKFTQRALQEGKNEQEKLLSDLEGSTQQGSGTAARDIARSLIETTTRAQTAVAGSDRKGARQALEELKDPAQALRALASPAAGQ
jgi:hypothetical protein